MGLYDEENAEVCAGDVDAESYWSARAAAEKMEAALNTTQPKDALEKWLPKAIRIFDEALAVYPNHEDIRRWKAKAVFLRTDREIPEWPQWHGGFPWAQLPYFQGWISLHWARYCRTVEENRDWRTIYRESRKVRTTWEKCFNLHEWREEDRAFLENGYEEALRLENESRPHTM